MPIAPEIVSAGLGLLGGLMGQSPGRVTNDNIRNMAAGSRRWGEKYGFNPLTLLGVSGAAVSNTGYNPVGAAVADAGMMLADGMAKRQDALALEKKERENAALKKEVMTLTLRPKVGGIYAERVAVPSLSEALGGGQNTQVSSPGLPLVNTGDLSAVRPLDGVDTGFFADPRRAVDNNPVNSHPGYISVDNPLLPIKLRVPTLDGDEPLHWYDYPDLALTGSIAFADFLGSPAFGPSEGYTRDGQPDLNLGKPPTVSNDKTRWKRRRLYGFLADPSKRAAFYAGH